MSGDIDRLRSMVDDLFVLSRLEAGKQRLDRLSVGLVELADGAVEAVTPLAAERGVEVRLTAAGAVPGTGDPRALDRVLRNLLDNAIRHARGRPHHHTGCRTHGFAIGRRPRRVG